MKLSGRSGAAFSRVAQEFTATGGTSSRVSWVLLSGLLTAPAVAQEIEGGRKVETYSQRCQSEVKIAGRLIGAGSFTIETTVLRRSKWAKSPEMATVRGDSTSQRRIWVAEAVTWRVSDVDAGYAASFASQWQSTCASGCAVHAMDSVDARMTYLVASKSLLGASPGASWNANIRRMYPQAKFAFVMLAATDRFPVWIFRDMAVPDHLEVGSCRREEFVP